MPGPPSAISGVFRSGRLCGASGHHNLANNGVATATAEENTFANLCKQRMNQHVLTLASFLVWYAIVKI